MTTRIRAQTNYQNGLIYTMRERGTDNIFYVGSTVSLRKRRNSHKSRCTNINCKKYHYEVYQHIRSIGGWEMIILEELHAFPCETRQELIKEEGRVYTEYIGKGYQLKNNNVPDRTRKEYQQDNRERIAERKKQYRQDNRERISERKKQYRQDNQERLAEYNKHYQQDNQERLAEYRKQYQQDNRERISEYFKQKVTCDCGATVSKHNLARHIKTKKHQKWEQQQ